MRIRKPAGQRAHHEQCGGRIALQPLHQKRTRDPQHLTGLVGAHILHAGRGLEQPGFPEKVVRPADGDDDLASLAVGEQYMYRVPTG